MPVCNNSEPPKEAPNPKPVKKPARKKKAEE